MIIAALSFLLVAFAFIAGFIMCCIEEPVIALAIVFVILGNLNDDSEY